jgi:threonine aldolase
MDFVDLRSDTVTHPTPAMREAMSNAQVGDDVYGEDPTVNRLQEIAALRMGKEAGLFVPSGTMGNLVAVLTHCNRGDEAMMGNLGHTFLFEGGGVAALGGVNPRTLNNQPDGSLLLEDILAGIRGDDPHFPISKLVILENTHNRCGGVPISAEYSQKVGEIAHRNGMFLHIDGARIFNAASAYSLAVSELSGPADSITFCLSKGLCAPVGSVLCGSGEFIRRANRIRKQLGGGMRQAGILAAAGIVALEQMVDRLSEDHQRARNLATSLEKIPGISLSNGLPPTNMVFITISDEVPLTAAEIVQRLMGHKIRVGITGPRSFRLVTHYWVDDEGVDRTIKAFAEVI